MRQQRINKVAARPAVVNGGRWRAAWCYNLHSPNYVGRFNHVLVFGFLGSAYFKRARRTNKKNTYLFLAFVVCCCLFRFQRKWGG